MSKGNYMAKERTVFSTKNNRTSTCKDGLGENLDPDLTPFTKTNTK